MNKENRTILKEIMQGKDLESNIPLYANAYIHTTYEYSMIRFVLNYYTMKEVLEENGGVCADEYLRDVLERIHTILFSTILSDEDLEQVDGVISSLNEIREEMTKRMTVLTAYTDSLQLYEYVLNRVEYGITGEEFPVDESALAARVFQYLFAENDTMVVNSKIQMVTAQLPIRMTKSRFFDYLTDTLNIYNGSEKKAFDDFVEMLKSTALLELPEGYDTMYPEIYKVIQMLEQTTFKTLDVDMYRDIMEQFGYATEYLTSIVSDYLLVMEILNDLYASLLAMPFVTATKETVKACVSMLKGLHDAFVSASEIPDSVDEGFMVIEGRQEQLGEELMQYESILQDVYDSNRDSISWMMLDSLFGNLLIISKLLSGSMFVDLNEQEQIVEMADSNYINKRRDELVGLLSSYFDAHGKEINRAVMSLLFSNMPVLFNSQQEIKDYIEYSINHCSNQSELMACAKILQELMEEE